MKHRNLVWTCIGLFTTAALAADVATVRVEVNGHVYAGQLADQTPTTGPASQPTSQPTKVPVLSLPPTPIAGMAPFQVHLDAADVVSPDAVRDSHVHWDFGDAAGTYDTLDGFNAGHVYDAAGKYTVTRTIASPAGESKKQWAVTVTPASRRVTYVSTTGDDRNDGKSPDHAVRTFDRAILGTNGGAGDVLFRRGEQFQITRSLNLKYDDIRLGAYGDVAQARPVLFNIGEIGAPMMIDAGGKRLIVEDLAFDAPKAKPGDKGGTLDVITARGVGLVVRRCTVLNVDDLINGNGKPDGVLIQDCDAPLETGLRAYFTWMQGSDWTLLGNHVANSTREHIVRVGGTDRLNIQFNHFANLNRTKSTTQPDSNDAAKGVLNVQKGTMLYAANNVLIGPNGVGPLGKQDGLSDKGGRFVGAVVEHNRITGSVAMQHGASVVTYRDNLIRADDTAAFVVDGYSKDYGRGVVDLRIEHNTVVNAGKTGNFMTMWGGAKDVAIVGNVYVAPSLVIGANESSVMTVLEPDQRAFKTIAGNVWPVAKPTGFAHNGLNYFAWKPGDAAGFIGQEQWAKLEVVANDRVEPIAVADWQKVRDAGVTVTALPAEKQDQTKEPAR